MIFLFPSMLLSMPEQPHLAGPFLLLPSVAATKPPVKPKEPTVNPQFRPKQNPTYFNVMFSDTDVSQVLQAISARTGASIVYAGKGPLPVTVTVRVDSPEAAVRSVASAAGLVYRKVNGTFIVAPATSMRQALEPYGETITLDVPDGYATKAVPALQESLPYLSVRSLGDRLVLTGLPEDILAAREFVGGLAQREVAARPITDSVIVSNTSAGEIARVVSSVYPDVRAATTTANGGGVVALTGPASSVAGAKALISRLDVAVPAGKAGYETRVVDLHFVSGKSMADFLKNAAPDVESFAGPESFGPGRPHFSPLSAIVGGSSTTASGAGSSGTGTGGASLGDVDDSQGSNAAGGTSGRGASAYRNDRSRVILLRGPSVAVDAAAALVARLDVRPRQVVVEVRVVETSKNFAENLGVQYNWSPVRFVEVPPGTSMPTFPYTDNPTQVTKDSGIGRFTRVPFDVLSTINAQVKDGKAKVLANPSVQVLDNEDANIFIGDTIRARVAQSTGFGAQTVDIKEFPIGIVLLLRPRIASDGTITMHVNPVVSTITGLDNNNIPQTSSREAETTVMVRDGETIVLGGLIRDEQSTTITRIPFLSQLPIVGELFKNRSTSKVRTDVVVTITPHLIADPSLPGAGK